MARITKATRIADAVDHLTRWERIRTVHRKYWFNLAAAAETGEHCAHVASYWMRRAEWSGDVRDQARKTLSDLLGVTL